MTVVMEKGKSFLGMPMVKVRNVLKAWRYGSSDPGDIAHRKDVQDDPRNIIALLSELEANGLTGIETGEGVLREYRRYGLTDRGRGLVNSTATKRMTRKAAELKFQNLLERAEAVNADPNAPRRVDRIWLFGSLLDPKKADIGDIDVVIESSRTPEFDDLVEEREDWDYLASHYPDLLPDARSYFQSAIADYTVLKKMLFGLRRNPAFAPNEYTILERLHEPCRLAFDRSRGGIVDDPVLPHLPTSKRRDKTIKPRLTMPGLALSEKLSYARFLSHGVWPLHLRSRDLWEEFGGDTFEWGNSDTMSYGEAIVTPADASGLIEAITGTPPPEDYSDVDGRTRFLVAFRRERRDGDLANGWFSVRRSVHTYRDDTLKEPPCDVRRVTCEVSAVELDGEMLERSEIEWAKDAILAMVGADLKLLHLRAKASGEEINLEFAIAVEERTPAGRLLAERLDCCGGYSHLPERERDGTCWELLTRPQPEFEEIGDAPVRSYSVWTETPHP